jgi:hypothetical protein
MMSEAQYAEFGQRIRRIDRHHRKLAKGYVTSMNHDGLVIARPQRKSSGLPARALFLTLVTLLVFKGFLLAQLGADVYVERMGILESGTLIEQVGAYAMKPDPITQWIATQIGNVF